MEKETWKNIPGYEGYYQASTLGRIKSVERLLIRSNGWKIPIKEKIIKRKKLHYGYLRAKMCKPGVHKIFFVHQLIAMAFLNHMPNGHKMVVDHIDANKINNKLSNLQIVTNRLNCSKDKKGYTSNYVGVSRYSDGRWTSSMWIDGRRRYLGYFTLEEEASAFYQKALKNIASFDGDIKKFRKSLAAE